MVFPYLKGLIVIKEILHIVLVYLLWCFCIQSLVLNNWYQSTFLGKPLADIRRRCSDTTTRAKNITHTQQHCGQIFFFADFFFWRRKKRAATFQKFSVYLCEKFA
jgi:hypothetical protein